jgi:fumarate reductase subunit D
MKKISALLVSLVTPLVAFAQNTFPVYTPGGNASLVTQNTGGNLVQILAVFKNLINSSIGILVTLALAVFFWGLVRFIFHIGGDGADADKKAKNLMVYGIIALFVMVSVWGLVAWIGSFFGISQGGGQSVQSCALIPGGCQ